MLDPSELLEELEPSDDVTPELDEVSVEVSLEVSLDVVELLPMLVVPLSVAELAVSSWAT